MNTKQDILRKQRMRRSGLGEISSEFLIDKPSAVEKEFILDMKTIRITKGLTQGKLAKILKISQSYLSKLEAGILHLDFFTFLTIIKHPLFASLKIKMAN